MADPFGRALLAQFRGEREEALLERDGQTVREHPIEAYYFDSPDEAWLTSTFEGPVLDMGAGAGRDTLALQDHCETVAIEVSQSLVTLLEERGVRAARQASMFDLTAVFNEDRFQSAFAIGTQLGLAGSIAGLDAFLEELAVVTKPGATVVLDGYDPTRPAARDLLGYRADPTPGLAYRVMWFEYDGTAGDVLLFRLFSPERIREATRGTPWTVTSVSRADGDHPAYYRIQLTTPDCEWIAAMSTTAGLFPRTTNRRQ